MFPNKIMLDVDDIAKALSHSKGHIYNLCSPKMIKKTGKSLPFKLDGNSDRILVSIVEIANYMDKDLLTKTEKQEVEKPSVPSMIVKPKPKRGRPIGSGRVSRLEAQFKQELSIAVVRYEFEQVILKVQEDIEALQYQDNQIPCAEKFDECKLEFSASISNARSSMMSSFLQLGLSNNKIDKPSISKI